MTAADAHGMPVREGYREADRRDGRRNMILRSFDKYADLGDYDPVSGELHPASCHPESRSHGWYAALGDERAVLYRDDRGVYLRIGDRLWTVWPQEGLSVTWRPARGWTPYGGGTAT
ncbi:hypothetical protein [Pilimelia columellifera]|uniref:Uncharacterized protein n=1 Tax=Pilimelia columellifera subsp. columellifera TaxID=706583 RepID=A0ABN3NHY4_9ACTN